jgi:hypothetical protein
MAYDFSNFFNQGRGQTGADRTAFDQPAQDNGQWSYGGSGAGGDQSQAPQPQYNGGGPDPFASFRNFPQQQYDQQTQPQQPDQYQQSFQQAGNDLMSQVQHHNTQAPAGHYGPDLTAMMQQYNGQGQGQPSQALIGQGYQQQGQQQNPNLQPWQQASPWTRQGSQFNVYGNGANQSFNELNGIVNTQDPNGAFGKFGWNAAAQLPGGMSEQEAMQMANLAARQDTNTDFNVFNTGNGYSIATRGRQPGQGLPFTGSLPRPAVPASIPTGGGYRAPLPAARGGYSAPVAAPRPSPFNAAQQQVLNAPIGQTDMNEEIASANSRRLPPYQVKPPLAPPYSGVPYAGPYAPSYYSGQGQPGPVAPQQQAFVGPYAPQYYAGPQQPPQAPAPVMPYLTPGWENNPNIGQYNTIPGYPTEVVGADGNTYPMNTPEAGGA